MQWHPDKFQDEEDKKKAEKKFIDIAAAKEVLTDEGRLFLNHKRPSKDKFLSQRCARSTTRVRIPLILRMVKGVVVDIRSDREDTPSTFQVVFGYFFRLFISTSRWPSLWWRAV